MPENILTSFSDLDWSKSGYADNKLDLVRAYNEYFFDKNKNAPYLQGGIRYAYPNFNILTNNATNAMIEYTVESDNISRLRATGISDTSNTLTTAPTYNYFDTIKNTDQLNLNKLVIVLSVAKFSDYIKQYSNYNYTEAKAFLLSSYDERRKGRDNTGYNFGAGFLIPADFTDITENFDDRYAYPKIIPYSYDIGDYLVISGIRGVYYGDVPRQTISVSTLGVSRVYESAGINTQVVDSANKSYDNVYTEFSSNTNVYNFTLSELDRRFLLISGNVFSARTNTRYLQITKPLYFEMIGAYIAEEISKEEGAPIFNNGYVRFEDNILIGVQDFDCKIIGMYRNDVQTVVKDDRLCVPRTATPALVNNTDYYCNVDTLGFFPVFKSFEDIQKYFLHWGLNVFSEEQTEQAQTTPPEDLPNHNPDIPAPGFGTNPNIPNVPGSADNGTDDFNDVIPTLSPSNLLSAYVYNFNSARRVLTWFTKSEFYDNLSRLFNDPLSAIISLKMYPLDFVKHDSNHVSAQGYTTIVNVTNDSISGYRIQEGYNTTIDGGSIDYKAYYGNFSDWSGATYNVYIPFYGIVSVPPSAVVNKHLTLKYALDYLSGEATAILRTGSGSGNGQLVGLYKCNLSFDVPITYDNYNQKVINTTLTALSGLSGFISGAQNLGSNIALGAATGGANAGGILSSAMGLTGNIANTGFNMLNQAVQTPLEMGAKGNISPLSAFSLPNTAYLLVSRKNLAIPATGYNSLVGSPSAYYGSVSGASGGGNNFVKITSIRLDFPATDSEKSELLNLLSDGIFI